MKASKIKNLLNFIHNKKQFFIASYQYDEAGKIVFDFVGTVGYGNGKNLFLSFSGQGSATQRTLEKALAEWLQTNTPEPFNIKMAYEE